MFPVSKWLSPRLAFGQLCRLALLVATPVVFAMPAQTALPDAGALPSLAPMLREVNPAVVNIATYTTRPVRNPLFDDPFFRRFFNVPRTQRYRRTRSAGSGVIADAGRGYIVTNHHVVARADDVDVTLSDGRVLEATLVGTDPEVDLAVLRVRADDLTQIRFSDSDQLLVGDFVVAIGNPFGLQQTVTSGIVSALGRSGLGIEGIEDFIQTDASINPGNSGGALVDLSGGLVGINTALYSPAGVNVGIGFAIPANLVRSVVDQIIKHGVVQRGYLGIQVQDLTSDLAEAFNLSEDRGVVVVSVMPGAAVSGKIESGDVIVAIGDKPVNGTGDFQSETATVFVGDELDLELVRGGERRKVSILIETDRLEKVDGAHLSALLAGTELQNFSNDQEEGDGVLVTGVSTGSGAEIAGLRQGDVIVDVNRQQVRDLRDLREAVRHNSGQILLRVYRSGRFGIIVVR